MVKPTDTATAMSGICRVPWAVSPRAATQPRLASTRNLRAQGAVAGGGRFSVRRRPRRTERTSLMHVTFSATAWPSAALEPPPARGRLACHARPPEAAIVGRPRPVNQYTNVRRSTEVVALSAGGYGTVGPVPDGGVLGSLSVTIMSGTAMPLRPAPRAAAGPSTNGRPGRPKGSADAAPVHVANSRCKKFQSTRKKALRIVQERPISGTDDQGRPYNRVVWRRVRCANCGQHRVEIEKHYDGDSL